MRKWLGASMFALLAIACTGLTLGAPPASAQPRTIKVLVPFPPGGSADILARLLGDQVGKAQGEEMRAYKYDVSLSPTINAPTTPSRTGSRRRVTPSIRRRDTPTRTTR